MNQELADHVSSHSCGWTKYFVIVPNASGFVERQLIRITTIDRGRTVKRKVRRDFVKTILF